ncbi:hypothetical protein FRC0405_01817 [Corynebacterium diphtheriae]|nr:hypothetical protein FRC0405_01817 [Corynebacterium diphtheriae]
MIKPPSRCVFNVWQMNKAEKRFQCSSMNRNHFLTFWAWFGCEKSRGGFQQLIGVPQLVIFSTQLGGLCHKVLRQPFSNVSPHVERACVHCLAVCQETPSLGATILPAACMKMLSAKMRSSTRRTTRSFASWSNFPWHVRRFFHLPKRNKTWGTSVPE